MNMEKSITKAMIMHFLKEFHVTKWETNGS